MEPITWLIIISAAVTAIATFITAMNHGASASDAALAAATTAGSVGLVGGLAYGKGNFSPANINKLLNTPAAENITEGFKDKVRIDAASKAVKENGSALFLLLVCGAGLLYLQSNSNKTIK